MKTSRYPLLTAGVGVFLIPAPPVFAQSTGGPCRGKPKLLHPC